MPTPDLAPPTEDTPEPAEQPEATTQDVSADGERDAEEDVVGDPDEQVEFDPVADGLFTGEEPTETDDIFTDEIDDTMESDDPKESVRGASVDEALGLGDEQINIETVINEGAARLAVVGLDSEYKLGEDESASDSECLEAELHNVFETFRLGFFGAGFLEKYVFVEEEAVDPAWGLLGAMCCACAITLWMRPDGDEIVQDATQSISGLGGAR